MKKFIYSFIFISLFFISDISFCQDEDGWTFVAENDTYMVYLNKDSTKNIGDSNTDFDVWLKWVCKTDCNDGYKSIAYSIQNWNLYCEKNEYNVPMIIDHYTDGEENIYTNENPSAVMENSPGEKVFNYFCNSKE